jgi:hypothetical protein
MTSEATAPAVILAFSFSVVGRSMWDDRGRSVFGAHRKPRASSVLIKSEPGLYILVLTRFFT